MSIAPFYIYRHIRPDKNEVFYIGKGNNLDKRISSYSRAIAKNKRSDRWKRVVGVNGGIFECEILYECQTETECNRKEKEFIKIYGRRDKNEGTLVNFTDGGDGQLGYIMPKEILLKRSERIKGANHPYYGKLPPNSKKVINVITGEVFDAIRDAAKQFGVESCVLASWLSGKRTNISPFVYLFQYNDMGKDACLKLINKPVGKSKGRSRVVVNILTGVEYKNAKDASKETLFGAVYFREMLRGKYPNKTHFIYK